MPVSPAPASPRLLVADQVAGAVHVLSLPDGRETGRVEGRHLAEHAGFLALPGGRTAFVDDLAGELVVLDPYGPDAGRPLTAATVPVAVPAEHLAADPTGRLLAVTTGLGRNWEPWSDLLTAVDLGAPGGPRSVRVRTRTGEPGVTVLGGTAQQDALVVLRHREPGSLTAYRHADLMSAAPACPPAVPAAELPLADYDGHGDAHDPSSGRLFAATGSGVRRARRDGGGLVAEEPLPWAGEGRGYYLRLDPARRTLWSCVRGGPTDPGRWPEWTNDAWWHSLERGSTGRLPLGPGLVFRLAVAARRTAFARVHPDGDELVLVATDTDSPAVVARLPLPAMDGAPRPGGTPWDGVQRRAVAASPGSPLVAVTRGGHGEIHLIDAEAAPGASPLVTTLKVPTPLNDGGHLALITPGDGAHGDPVGR
ncbi:hypothetical protein ACH46N_00705 [Streptomyces pristinaespiralis]|uniref:Uncharacterized protein n=1 Tax=Streptomyces pristinaespiralis TaxID=38300 RepID=A0A0M4D2K2_STRPR|nr:hypothetical protein [Streptomyces pristinaespiralis]ALC19916.1 hypothetical protein SPRI_1610 [Streptomyces pristinaespiralis]QMU17138.1 hypothetical protein H3L99_28915 [Streptomyces pristinaespiralis]